MMYANCGFLNPSMKKSLSLTTLILVFVSGIAWADTAVEWFMKGQDAFVANNYDRAIECYKKAISIDPNQAVVHCYLGLSYGIKGMIDEAILEYKKAIKISPNYAYAHQYLGAAYNKKGMLDEAIIEHKKALSIDPNNILAHRELGRLYEEKGMSDEAIDEYNKAIAIDPDYAFTYYSLGMIYVQKGMLDEAMAEFKKAIAIDPNIGGTHYSLGMIYVQKGMLDEAINEFRKGIAINPNDKVAHYLLGFGYVQKGMLDEAINEFKKAIAIDPNDKGAHYSLGEVYNKKGMPNEAVLEYEKVIAIDPNNDGAHYNLGLIYSHNNFNSTAADYFYKAGLLALEQGDRGMALEAYEGLKQTNSPKLENALFAKLYPTNGIPSTQHKIVTSYTGTGFAISRDGLIVTACHLVQEASSIKVYLHDGSTVAATIQTKDPLNDIAIIKIKTPTPTFLAIAPSRSVKTGDRVFTVGFPISSLLGQEAKYTEGVISSLSGIEGTPSFFQITVPIQPGNSGGPLVNEDGYVVGVISSTVAISAFLTNTGTLPQNVNWAVKADYLRPLIDLPSPVLRKANRQEIIERTKNTTFLIEVVN